MRVLRLVVNGTWGLRVEGAQQLAERWLAFLDALEGIAGTSFPGWREATDNDRTAPLLSPSVASLTDYLRRENPESEADRAAHTASLWTAGAGLPELVVSVSAGGSSPHVAGSCAVRMRSRELDESAPVARHSAEILRALADCWDADWGQAYNRAEYGAVEEEFGLEVPDPRCCRAAYLSARRAELVPEDLPGKPARIRTSHDGLLIDLTDGGTQRPDIKTMLEVNRALRTAGALARLPEPYDRAKL
ncbi:Imm52 family immunity protein [Streptomyces sp. NPDC085946]|uniref:Imm52 family immunity protein n=1 Tax=Streptomyces sp. NPDC085946 TaxID=3365744 RepID=UPI0037D5D2B8